MVFSGIVLMRLHAHENSQNDDVLTFLTLNENQNKNNFGKKPMIFRWPKSWGVFEEEGEVKKWNSVSTFGCNVEFSGRYFIYKCETAFSKQQILLKQLI